MKVLICICCPTALQWVARGLHWSSQTGTRGLELTCLGVGCDVGSVTVRILRVLKVHGVKFIPIVQLLNAFVEYYCSS